MTGSRFSICGDARFDDGEGTWNGLEKAEGGVGRGMTPLGDRRSSDALWGLTPPDDMDAGVMSCVLLDFEWRTRGAGEPLRSRAGDLGGTCGGSSKLVVSTLSKGFGVAPGLRIGDKGFPVT